MSLIYDQKIVSHIQNCLNTGNVIIESAKSYDTLIPGNHFKLGKIEVVFLKSNHPKIPGYIASSIMAETATKSYMTEWKKLPLTTHLIKDMKMLKKDMNNEVPYKTFTYTDINGNKKTALVRRLFEIEEMDADQPECVEYYENYTDLIHLDQCYLIIKIIDADSNTYNQRLDIKISSGEIISDFIPSMTPTTLPDDSVKTKSEPLF